MTWNCDVTWTWFNQKYIITRPTLWSLCWLIKNKATHSLFTQYIISCVAKVFNLPNSLECLCDWNSRTSPSDTALVSSTLTWLYGLEMSNDSLLLWSNSLIWWDMLANFTKNVVIVIPMKKAKPNATRIDRVPPTPVAIFKWLAASKTVILDF